jgi:hypothetical protein
MKYPTYIIRWGRPIAVLLFGLLFCWQALLIPQPTTAADLIAAPTDEAFAYGFNVAEWDINRVQGMGFNWIKVFNPPAERLPVKVL